MLGGELIDGGSPDKAVQRGDHRGAFAGGMLRRAVQRVGQEQLRFLRLRDHFIQRRDLFTNGAAPLGAGSVEDGRCGIQGQSQPVGDLDERQPS
jgi:hypothetical protein